MASVQSPVTGPVAKLAAVYLSSSSALTFFFLVFVIISHINGINSIYCKKNYDSEKPLKYFFFLPTAHITSQYGTPMCLQTEAPWLGLLIAAHFQLLPSSRELICIAVYALTVLLLIVWPTCYIDLQQIMQNSLIKKKRNWVFVYKYSELKISSSRHDTYGFALHILGNEVVGVNYDKCLYVMEVKKV